MRVRIRQRQAHCRRLLAFLMAAAPLVLACSVHHVEPAHGNAEKIYVCHKGKTLEVADQALSAHMGHGDGRGPCL